MTVHGCREYMSLTTKVCTQTWLHTLHSPFNTMPITITVTHGSWQQHRAPILDSTSQKVARQVAQQVAQQLCQAQAQPALCFWWRFFSPVGKFLHPRGKLRITPAYADQRSGCYLVTVHRRGELEQLQQLSVDPVVGPTPARYMHRTT